MVSIQQNKAWQLLAEFTALLAILGTRNSICIIATVSHHSDMRLNLLVIGWN
uniref:Uncharacterized protein n=1 Tax=Arundo donax TaxID=35708 RepID=A0A0A8YTB3_ARUDO